MRYYREYLAPKKKRLNKNATWLTNILIKNPIDIHYV